MRNRRGFLLALVMLMIPVSLLMVFSLTRVIFQESGFSMQAQARTKAFYVCQAGLNTAYHVLSCNNFRGHTHESNGTTLTSSSDPDYLQSYTRSFLTLDGDGWYTWTWDGADARSSFTRSGQPEAYRFQIYFPSPGRWVINGEGSVGGYIARQEQSGSLGPAFEYSVFDNGNTTDFARAEKHLVEGKVHANGNLYLRPWTTPGLSILGISIIDEVEPATLDLKVDSLTSARQIIRTEDYLGNEEPDQAYVRISKGGRSGPLVAMESSWDPGGAYDSTKPAWTNSDSTGALKKFGGTVVDSKLGAVRQSPPARQTLTPGGYYDQKAGLRINSATSQPWCTEKSFYNQSENREVTVKEIDVAALQAAGAFPPNGIIYSNVPVRLVNAHQLPGDLTVASCAAVYTKGDFNKDNPTGASSDQRHSASILTTSRVWNLTSSFDDGDSYTYPPTPLHMLARQATDDPLYPGDPPDVLEINAAITDGQPSEEVRAWQLPTPGNPNPFYVSDGNELLGAKLIPPSHDPSHPALIKAAYPSIDPLLENLQGMKVAYRGARVHNRQGIMSKDYANAEAATNPRVLPWLVKAAYMPPEDRDQKGDDQLVDRPPPGAPNVARKLLWRVK